MRAPSLGHGVEDAICAGCDLHTVCESARCPNIHECFHRGTATFMILGRPCARAAAASARCPKARRARTTCALDPDEPANVARMAARMRLRHVVITSVTATISPTAARPTSPKPCARCAGAARGARRGADARISAATWTPWRACSTPAPTSSTTTWRRWSGSTTRVRPHAGYQQLARSAASSHAVTARDVLDQIRAHGGPGRDARRECDAAAPRPARGRMWTSSPSASICNPRGATCPVAEYVAPAQFDAYRAVRALARLQDGLQRAAGAQFLHGGHRQGGHPRESRLAEPDCSSLASAVLLILVFPRWTRGCWRRWRWRRCWWPSRANRARGAAS